MLRLGGIARYLDIKELRDIKSATWDGESVQVESCDIDLLGAERQITVDAKLVKGGQKHAVTAAHSLDDRKNEIQIDAADVDQDDVDLDFDLHPFARKVELEYRLQYTQDGTFHTIVLRAETKIAFPF